MNKDVVWGYLAQFLQYGASLLVLPLLLRKLSSAELGVWYVFMTISAFVTMLDMGFTPTLARNVSYVMGGARQLMRSGYAVVDQAAGVDYGLFKAIIVAARRIFFCIGLLAFFILLIPGSWYISHVTQNQVDLQTVLIAWSIFVVATIVNLYYKYYTPLLQGRGLYAEFYKTSAIANLAFIVVTAILLQTNLGLIGVACGFLVSALISRYLSWHYFYDQEFKQRLAKAAQAAVSTLEVFKILWHNAWRLGLGVVGAFLILRANTLLSSMYLGLATTAAYALTLQVFSVLQSVSTVFFNVQQPKLAQYRLLNHHQLLVNTVKQGLGSSLGLFLLGALGVVCMGTPLIKMMGTHTSLLSIPLLIAISCMVLLELNHSLAAGVIITGNNVPFVKPSLLSGCVIFIMSWIGLKYADQGVGWLIAIQFTVQLAYNNWKWPLVMYKELTYLNSQASRPAPVI